ncbi:DUF1345 domain-containing protein [Hydrogenophaga sp.]|uniref:DUF1345 domain-containing protein n=1 Tax=Hydrogenophaga sp. TaxID=1904254 RepID=UPI003F6F606A
MKWPFHLTAWQRQGLAVLPAALACTLSAIWLPEPPATMWLVGWITYCATYVALVWHLAARLDASTTQQWAQREDPGAPMLFVFVTAAACVSLVVVAISVSNTRTLQGGERGLQLALMALSLAGAWLLIQCVFTLHYARVYYRDGPASGPLDRGLAFPDGRDPDYLDLLYHSMVVGMTSQVADVSVRSRPMRHLVLVHALLSFAFNLGVLATAVNVFASAGH